MLHSKQWVDGLLDKRTRALSNGRTKHCTLFNNCLVYSHESYSELEI